MAYSVTLALCSFKAIMKDLLMTFNIDECSDFLLKTSK